MNSVQPQCVDCQKFMRYYRIIGTNKKVGLVKKICLIGSAFLVSNAKNDRLRLNNIESVILCVFMTDSIMLFSFYTAMLNIYQNFLGIFTKNRSFNIINRFFVLLYQKCMNYIFLFR